MSKVLQITGDELETLASKVTKKLDLEVLESKLFGKAEKMVGTLTAKSIIEKTDHELKDFISASSAFLQKEKDLMAEEAAVKAAKNVLAEKRKELRDVTKEQKVLLELAVLTYSKRI